MKPTRVKQHQRKVVKQKAGATDVVKVFCRVKPLGSEDVSCMRIDTSNTVTIVCPDVSNRNSSRECRYMFKQVFGDEASQKAVFEGVALPLVEGLIQGKNGLLFAYGVTDGGKTFTMTGEPHNVGIMPRCLDIIFNTVLEFQSRKFVFQPVKMNGFDIQNESGAI